MTTATNPRLTTLPAGFRELNPGHATGAEPEHDSPDESGDPRFALQILAVDLLAALANGAIDAQALAAWELANRGRAIDGEWIGFNEAGAAWAERFNNPAGPFRRK